MKKFKNGSVAAYAEYTELVQSENRTKYLHDGFQTPLVQHCITTKNVPEHILTPGTVACDILYLCANTILPKDSHNIRNKVSYIIE